MSTIPKPFKYIVIIAFSAILAGLLYMGPRVKAEPELVIYDVHPNSPRIVKDDGSIEHADYVRIRNMTNHPCDLTGMYLSDSKDKYDKLPLDGAIIEPNGSQMIRLDPSWNFALSMTKNENVYLSDSKGNIIFRYSKKMKPKAPTLSANSGFYTDEFALSMSVKGNYTIHYTLDGSDPTTDSPVYETPIHVYDRSSEPNSVVNTPNIIKNYLDETDEEGHPIEQPKEETVDKAFIVRAASIDKYGNRSDIVTREYFFCGSKYRNIMSVIADPEDLFGDYGIVSVGKEYDDWYLGDREGGSPSVNYNKKGVDWEVPASMDYYREGTKFLTQDCGLRLQGRTTRDRRIKNFQLRARNRYSGSDVFEYDFFDNEKYRSDTVTLDDSFKESLFLALIENEPIIKQKTTERVALFINGEFWNNVYIRQKLDEKYFADHFGTTDDNLIVLAESFPEIGGRTQEEWDSDRQFYLDIDEFALNNDLSDPGNYAKITQMMDIDSFLDYIAINTWVGCNDWSEYENDMYWRVRLPDDSVYGDGRFRWIIHDGDNVFNKEVLITDEGFQNECFIFKSLMNNAQFRADLVKKLRELGTTSFSDENIKTVLHSGKWDEAGLSEIESFLLNRKYTIDDLIENDLEP